VFSCSKIEQKQLNTWVSFQSAEQPLLGQFSVSGNKSDLKRVMFNFQIRDDLHGFENPYGGGSRCCSHTAHLRPYRFNHGDLVRRDSAKR
jgi:hypothetical protein